MREILEHYGLGLVELIGVLGVMAIVFSFLGDGGAISSLVQDYMHSISG